MFDTLMPDLVGHDRKPASFLVYLFLWRKTRGAGVKGRPLSLQEIAEGTGLSKRGMQDALSRLDPAALDRGAAREHQGRGGVFGTASLVERRMNQESQ